MSDLLHASYLFLVFGAALALYGLALARTGSSDLMPYRTRHSIRGPQDVRRVGRIVVVLGVAVDVACLAAIAVARAALG